MSLIPYKLKWSLLGKWDDDIRRSLSLAYDWWTAGEEYEGWLFEGIVNCLAMNDVMSKIYITDPVFPSDIKIPKLIEKSLSALDNQGIRRPSFIFATNSKLLRVMESNDLSIVCEYETSIKDEEHFTGYQKMCIIKSRDGDYYLEKL